MFGNKKVGQSHENVAAPLFVTDQVKISELYCVQSLSYAVCIVYNDYIKTARGIGYEDSGFWFL